MFWASVYIYIYYIYTLDFSRRAPRGVQVELFLSTCCINRKSKVFFIGIDMPSDNACNKYQPMFPYSKRAVSKYCLLGCRLSCQLVRSWKVLILLLQIPPNTTQNTSKRSQNASQKTPRDPHLEQLSPKQEHRMSCMGFGKHLGGQWRHIRLPRSREIVKRRSRGWS